MELKKVGRKNRAANHLGGKSAGWQKSWAAKECLLLRAAKVLGGKRVFIIVGGKRAGRQECFLLWAAKEFGRKRAGRQKSVYHCGWQKCWAAKECLLLWVANELGVKRVFFIVGGKGVFVICGKNSGGKRSGVAAL